ncbi:MAG: hypothetical protein Q9224_007625 [Gallowayella concinna]
MLCYASPGEHETHLSQPPKTAHDLGTAEPIRTDIIEIKLVEYKGDVFQSQHVVEYLSRLRIIRFLNRQFKPHGSNFVCAYTANGSVKVDQVLSTGKVEGVVLVPQVKGFKQDGSTGSKNCETAVWGGMYDIGSFLLDLFICPDDSPSLLSHRLGDHG